MQEIVVGQYTAIHGLGLKQNSYFWRRFHPGLYDIVYDTWLSNATAAIEVLNVMVDFEFIDLYLHS